MGGAIDNRTRAKEASNWAFASKTVRMSRTSSTRAKSPTDLVVEVPFLVARHAWMGRETPRRRPCILSCALRPWPSGSQQARHLEDISVSPGEVVLLQAAEGLELQFAEPSGSV